MSALDTLAPPRTTRPPQLGALPAAKPTGPSPFAVVGAALAVGIVLARWIDRRSHGHARR